MANPKKLPKWAIKQAGGINKKAWALARRGRGKVSSKPRRAAAKRTPARKRSRSVAKKSNPNRAPKIGAAIQAFKGTQPLVAPVIDSVVRNGATPAAVNSMRRKANASYAGNVAMTGINQAVDRKIAQGAALSRGSVTAWLAEGYAGFQAVNEVRGISGKEAALGVNRKLAKTINGYDPVSGNMDLTDPDFRTYQTLKLVGGAARRLSNVGPFKRIAAPAKRFLGEMGGAL